MALTYDSRASLRSRAFRLSLRGSLKHGFSQENAVEDKVDEAARALWIAIISE